MHLSSSTAGVVIVPLWPLTTCSKWDTETCFPWMEASANGGKEVFLFLRDSNLNRFRSAAGRNYFPSASPRCQSGECGQSILGRLQLRARTGILAAWHSQCVSRAPSPKSRRLYKYVPQG